MGMRKNTIKFLDKMAERGENQFPLSRMQIQLINIADIGRNEVKAYTRYLVESELVKNVRGDIYEINHDLRLELGGETNAKNKQND